MPRVAPRITLTENQKTALEVVIQDVESRLGPVRCTDDRSYIHAKIILLATEGRTNKDIAESLGLKEHTVAKWRNRFLNGGISVLGRPGRREGEKKATDQELAQMITRILRDNPKFSSRKVTELLKDIGGGRYEFSHSTINLIINDFGLRENAEEYWKDLQKLEVGGRYVEIEALIQNPYFAGLLLRNEYIETVPDDFSKYGRVQNLLVAQLVSDRDACGPEYTEKEAANEFLKDISEVLEEDQEQELFLILYADLEAEKVVRWLNEHGHHLKYQVIASQDTWVSFVEVFLKLLIKKGADIPILGSDEEVVRSIVRNIQKCQEDRRKFEWKLRTDTVK